MSVKEFIFFSALLISNNVFTQARPVVLFDPTNKYAAKYEFSKDTSRAGFSVYYRGYYEETVRKKILDEYEVV
ncbi:hypothetical protein CHU92_01575 [Flavobacterium cyanobacteriorum]|uniref:Uncharacterized protein n=1 Tax=Flavobacterium cyanobacteriorum TaxID=2022802 RepID=A0A255ZZB0_9FLAO|nr:hypothetical protein [Flavobacterium cyanobacteriorum]OYQ46130.1 hypothetical protein CHU92_01575 [Flavobacterium cyanobacteriorum]